MKAIMLSLFWPAAAGNVAWAFFTLAITEKWSTDDVIPRLVVLLLMTFYLSINWVRVQSSPGSHNNPFYFFADAIHLVTIIVFSIATLLNKDWLITSLEIIFIVAVIGHLMGVWEDKESANNLYERFLLAGANSLGLILLCTRDYFNIPDPWSLSASVALVLFSWFIVRWHILPGLRKRQTYHTC